MSARLIEKPDNSIGDASLAELLFRRPLQRLHATPKAYKYCIGHWVESGLTCSIPMYELVTQGQLDELLDFVGTTCSSSHRSHTSDVDRLMFSRCFMATTNASPMGPRGGCRSAPIILMTPRSNAGARLKVFVQHRQFIC